jgi:Domain of Unknown Function (DUF928)
MKISVLVAFVSIAFIADKNLIAEDPSVSPAPSATAAAAASPSPARAPMKLLYKPPAGAGNIPTRVSGGARGDNGLDTVLLPLVPDQLALTTQAQPSLFWFQSKPAKAKFELTVVEPNKPTPLISLTSPDADKPGIHRIKLARYKVELQPDVAYEWSVAIVPDAENRSKDVIAKGVIKRVRPPGDLASRVEKAGDLERASAYAQAGIWYDALDAISNAIEAHPDDASLKEERASLLKQVGLTQAAALDQKK